MNAAHCLKSCIPQLKLEWSLKLGNRVVKWRQTGECGGSPHSSAIIKHRPCYDWHPHWKFSHLFYCMHGFFIIDLNKKSEQRKVCRALLSLSLICQGDIHMRVGNYPILWQCWTRWNVPSSPLVRQWLVLAVHHCLPMLYWQLHWSSDRHFCSLVFQATHLLLLFLLKNPMLLSLLQQSSSLCR